jgi:hypothetical protein
MLMRFGKCMRKAFHNNMARLGRNRRGFMSRLRRIEIVPARAAIVARVFRCFSTAMPWFDSEPSDCGRICRSINLSVAFPMGSGDNLSFSVHAEFLPISVPRSPHRKMSLLISRAGFHEAFLVWKIYFAVDVTRARAFCLAWVRGVPEVSGR